MLKELGVEARAFYRDAVTLRDFVRLVYLRLGRSRKASRWVSRRSVNLSLKSLGGNVQLRTRTTDLEVYKEIVLQDSLGSLKADPTARVVVDLGANIGLSYRWLRRRYPNARIVCVEPDPGNVAILRSTAAADKDCDIADACIGGRERQVSLGEGTGEWGFRILDEPGDVPVLTMPQLLSDYHLDTVDILKCDIEGAERELFENCAEWIGQVRALIVECHLDVIDASTLCDLLAANGGDFSMPQLKRDHEWELVTLNAVSHDAQ